ncbi:TonB-dependent receptor [Aquisediminimonas sediminicola]|uniref:TonB-dependent receptor n=1 Tax=Alteraquisediminimonas sediminicola TaxID=2676787 RepID=UPI001C8DEFE7|nr:TonB-dependent receptor [Aquisediminimonas sediminicola]
MLRSNTPTLRNTAAMLALAVALASANAHAETAMETAEAGGLVEITVTAQKQESNLQKTPIAMSVVGAVDLQNRSVQSIADLADGAIPSLRIAPFYSRSSAITVGIRGIVPFDANQPSRDSGVGVYIDGVYLGRSQGLGAALYDIERIEVLKGPQGTLFGRNATGGAVSIVTRKPSGELKFRQTVGLRNYDGYTSETHIDLPKFANLSLKFDGIVTKRDGTINNPMAGEDDFNSYDRRGLHVRALWEPTDNFSADYGFDISYDATTPYYVQLLSLKPGFSTGSTLAQVQPTRTKIADIGTLQQESIGKTHGHMLQLDWNPLESLEVRSISSYRKLTQSQWDNGAGAHSKPAVGGKTFSRYSLADLAQEQYSQELQLLGSLPQLTYVAGLYYYHEKGEDSAWAPDTLKWNADPNTGYSVLPSLSAGAATAFPDRLSTAKAKSFAAFGQATWTPPVLNDALHLTVGARYTHDKKSGVLLQVSGALPIRPVIGEGVVPFSFSSSRVDPAFTLAFDATDDIHAYAKWGQAYRAGGANSRSLTYRAFDPEKVQTIEAGLKTEFFDDHARINLAAYETRYKNMQVDFNATLVGSNRTTIETVNTPTTAKIKGIEVDASLNPLPGVTLSASYAYTDSKLPKVTNPFAAVPTPEQIYLVYTPKHAFSTSLDFEQPLGFGTFRMHLDANGATGYHALSNDPVKTDKSFIVNGRISIGDIDLTNSTNLQLSLWSRNMFDEEHTFLLNSTGYRSGATVAGQVGIFNEPRTYGVDATIRF